MPAAPSESVNQEAQSSIVDRERGLDERPEELESQSDTTPEDTTNRSLGDRLKTEAMSGWASVSNSIKNQSKLASMRAQIEKLMSEDLRAAHHSLGEKCFNSELFSDQLREQYQVIRELDAMIAEKRAPEDFEIGETKMATLKRLGKNVVHSSQAQAMLLKRQGLLTELGKAAYLLGESEGMPGIETEKNIVKGIEAQIRKIEEMMAEQMDVMPQASSTVSQDSPSKSDSSHRGGSSTVDNNGGISAIFWQLRNLVTRKIAIASCIILASL